MISRHIPIAPKNDNYGRLARYIARIGEYADGSEPPALAWCAGCASGEDYAEGIAETQDTQALNTRAAGNKSYHLVVSFRPEDQVTLTPEKLREIERRFAETLGLADHQRHCAVHADTGNLHIQIVYNLIHPETLTRNSHSWDYAKRNTLCRLLEREYGLAVDTGMEKDKAERRNERATAMEAQQGVQSFDSYARESWKIIMEVLETATHWQDLHTSLARHGLELAERGNGLVLRNRHGKEAVKASDADRRLSKKRLEAALGPYQKPVRQYVAEVSRYQARPVQRHPASAALYAEYQREKTERKTALARLREGQAETLSAVRERWKLERARIERLGIDKRNRRNLLQLARQKETAELAAARADNERTRAAFALEHPARSWHEFLCRQAERGDETALAVLRSRNETTVPEHDPANPAPDRSAASAIRAEYAERQAQVLESENLMRKGKRQLQAFLRMDELLLEETARGAPPGVPDVLTRRVDKKGAVVFTLPGGGKIRDTGAEVWFSTDPEAERLAALYAAKKWGQRLFVDRGRIRFDRDKAVEREAPRREPEKGLSR